MRTPLGGFSPEWSQGTEAAVADPEGATDIMEQDWRARTTRRSSWRESVPATIDLLTPADGTAIGCLNLDNWATYGTWMSDNELLKAPIDVADVATNDYGDGC